MNESEVVQQVKMRWNKSPNTTIDVSVYEWKILARTYRDRLLEPEQHWADDESDASVLCVPRETLYRLFGQVDAV
ncbi:MAG TPA: hypothetical protein V6C97_27240 [Oculatellaceae cyanobacterium]